MEFPVRIYKRPRLVQPSLVVGWVDAGLVGMRAISYLIDQLGAKEFGEIEPASYFALPRSLVKGGILQEIEYPGACFYYWKGKKGTADLIILGSEPPTVKHFEFANHVLDVAELFGVKKLYTVGGINANTAHGERPTVFAIVNNRRLKQDLKTNGVELGGDYQGPASMNGLLLGLARNREIDGISLWGQVPGYIAEIPNPRVCQAVLRVLARMLAIELDFSEIEAEAQYTDKQIDELVTYVRQRNPDLDQYLGKLEKGPKVKGSERDKEKIFREIEAFLKRQRRSRPEGG